MNHKVAIVVPSTIQGTEKASNDFVFDWVRIAKFRFLDFLKRQLTGRTLKHARGQLLCYSQPDGSTAF